MKNKLKAAEDVLTLAVHAELEATAPITPEDFTRVGTLTLTHFIGTPDFGRLPDLWFLAVIDAGQLEIQELPRRLEYLSLSNTDLVDIRALEHLQLVTRLELAESPIRDLTPLLSLPKLKKLRLYQLPLDAHSVEVVLPELEARGVKVNWTYKFEADALELGWALIDAGLPLLCLSADFIKAPGTGLPSLHNLTRAQVLELAAEPGITVQAIWDRHYVEPVPTPPTKDPNAFDWAAHKTHGRATDARQWVDDSALPDDWKAHLHTFINRFAEDTFEKWDADALAREEKICGCEFPQWLRDVITTLDQLNAGYWLFEFDPTVESRGIYRGDNPWFHQRPARIGTSGAADCVAKGMLPFCDNTEEVLGISLGGEDTGVYLFSIGKAMEGAAVTDGRRVFDSLPEMMANIAEHG